MLSKTNAKYRGTSINAGNTDIDIEWEEQEWYGSDFAYNINYTAGDPVVKIQLNIDHDWIRKNIYLETDGVRVKSPIIGTVTPRLISFSLM